MTSASKSGSEPLLRSKTPLYRQIAELLEQKIDAQVFGDSRLPTERQLAREFGVSTITIKQSLNILENKGLVSRRARHGTFIRHRTDAPVSKASAVKTIRWLRAGDLTHSQSVDAAICERFESLHTGWRVALEDVRDVETVPGGVEQAIGRADVLSMNIDWFTRLFAEGRLLELDGMLSNKIDPGDFIPTSLSQCRVQDKLWGLPRTLNLTALYLNRSMFERHGIDLPDKFDSWDALAQTLREIPEVVDGVPMVRFGYFGQFSPLFWENFLWQHGGDAFAPGEATCTLDQKEAIAGLETAASFLHRLPISAAANLSSGFPETFERHKGTDIACLMGGPFFSQYLRRSKDEWVTRMLPTNSSPCTAASTYIVSVGRNSESSNEAFNLLSLICGPFGQDLLGKFKVAMPSLQSSAKDVFAGEDRIDLRGFVESTEHVHLSMPWQYNPVIRRVLDENLPLIYSRAEPAAEVCGRIAAIVNVLGLKPNEVWPPDSVCVTS